MGGRRFTPGDRRVRYVTQRADGYRRVTLEDGTRMLEHHWVMEQAIGRPVAVGEVVHHLNHDPRDNRIENLELVESHSAHVSQHHGKTCSDGCTCGRHRPYVRTPEHRALMSASVSRALSERTGR